MKPGLLHWHRRRAKLLIANHAIDIVRKEFVLLFYLLSRRINAFVQILLTFYVPGRRHLSMPLLRALTCADISIRMRLEQMLWAVFAARGFEVRRHQVLGEVLKATLVFGDAMQRFIAILLQHQRVGLGEKLFTRLEVA